MKRLRRITIQAAVLFSLAFVLIAPSTSLSLAQQKQEIAAQTPSARRASSSVILTVTVTDRRRNYLKGLTRTNFTISDGKQEQQINAFTDGDVPVSVGILFDVSQSVKSETLKRVRAALGNFFQLSNKSNEYFLIGFNEQPKLLQDWTSDSASILKQIDNINPAGNTALYDACSVAVGKVMTGQHRKRAIILLTDGQDNGSRSKFNDVRRLLEESDTLLYCIGLLGGNDPSSIALPEGRTTLGELSSTTGGAVFFPERESQLNAVFDMIAIELRNQYLIGFTPTSIDGKRHSLKLSVTLPRDAPREMQSLTVRSRKGFYAKTK